jgi:hypothetical protein
MVSVESSRAYPIIGQVVSFLDQDTLDLRTGVSRYVSQSPTKLTKLEVKKWYDEFGW